MKSRRIAALLVVVIGVGVYVGNVLATPSSGQTTTILAKATVPDLDLSGHMATTVTGPNGNAHPGVWLAKIMTHGLSDGYVVDNKFAANGGTSGWHSHPGPSLVFVVAGTITNYSSDNPGCGPQVYTAGQSFVDPGGDDEHMLRNEDPTVVAETIAVQLIPAGATRRIDEPAPAGCPS
jgi:quercetin dioxygenase-like cupin family protein